MWRWPGALSKGSAALASDNNVIDFPASKRFLIKERLGGGGMGEVFRAFDTERGSEVALKVLRTTDPTALYMFKREFRALADVSHENLVQFYELVSAEDTWCLTMEIVDGVDFLHYVRHGHDAPDDDGDEQDGSGAAGKFRKLPTHVDDEGDTSILSATDLGARFAQGLTEPEQLERLVDGLRQLAAGVNALHDAGRLHRDIKPDNIMVTPSGRLVLLDFGVMADLADGDGDADIVGTPVYMSPEQAAGRALSPASDWYSVGVVLYEALTGRRPFGGALPQIIEARKRLEPPSPRHYAPDVPEDIDELCRGLLAPRPQNRPDGAEILRRLGAGNDAPASVLDSPELVGREAQLSQLRAAFNAAVQADPVVVLMHGAPGMGKTALLNTFLAEIERDEGAIVLSGRCYETESVPYKALDPLMDALCRYLLSMSQKRIAAATSFKLLALARLFPVLRRVQALVGLHGDDEPLPAAELRRRGISALRDILYTLSADAPIVLHVDDLHWGDLDSAMLLRELVRPPDAPPILFIGSFRTAEWDDHPFFRALMPLPCEVRELHVDRLSPNDTRRLVERMLGPGSEMVPALVNSVARESRGNLFFINELVRYVRAEIVSDTSIGTISLDEVVRHRIAELPDRARRLLDVVSVAGRPIREATARHAAQLVDNDAGEIALLKQRHLIRTRGGHGRDRLEPYHDRIGSLVVADLNGAQTHSIHRNLAVALALEEKPDIEALADHYAAAGELERAAKHWIAVGRQAQRALAFDHAASLFERAIATQALPENDRFAALAAHADVLADAGRGAEAATAYIKAAESADAGASLDFRRMAAEQLLRSGHIDEGVQLMESVLKASGISVTPNGRSVLWLVLRRARLRVRGFGYKLRDEGEIPPALLRRIDVLWSASCGLVMADHIRSADFQTRHMLLALKAGERHRLARAFVIEAGIASTGGDKARRRCTRILDMAEDLARQMPTRDIHGWIPGVRGLSAYQRGDFKQARTRCDQAVAILRKHSSGLVFEWVSVELYALWALYYLGEMREARRRIVRLVDEAEARSDIYSLTNLSTSLNVMAWLVSDEPDEASRRLDDAMAKWSQRGYHLQHYWEMVARVHIELYRGDNEAAWRAVADTWTDLRKSFLPRVQVVRIEGWTLRGRAAVAMAAAEPALLREARRCVKKVRREDVAWAQPLADLLCAGIAARTGDDDACLQFLETAQVGFTECHMGLFAAVVRCCRGKRIGGTEGHGLVAHAEQSMAEQGIVAPKKIVRTFAPGVAMD